MSNQISDYYNIDNIFHTCIIFLNSLKHFYNADNFFNNRFIKRFFFSFSAFFDEISYYINIIDAYSFQKEILNFKSIFISLSHNIELFMLNNDVIIELKTAMCEEKVIKNV